MLYLARLVLKLCFYLFILSSSPIGPRLTAPKEKLLEKLQVLVSPLPLTP
jgi:hypothetical protein